MMESPVGVWRRAADVDEGGKTRLGGMMERTRDTKKGGEGKYLDASPIPVKCTAAGGGGTAGGGSEGVSLDRIILAWLHQQHRQCPNPITPHPPLSLLHPHSCPLPSHRLHASPNLSSRLSDRQLSPLLHRCSARLLDRRLLFSRLRCVRTCRGAGADALPQPLTCCTFLSPQLLAAGNTDGEVRLFSTRSATGYPSTLCHQSPVLTLCAHSSPSPPLDASLFPVTAAMAGISPPPLPSSLLLSSSRREVKLWDASDLQLSGPLHSLPGCRSARFSHSGATIAAIDADTGRRALLFDVHSGLERRALLPAAPFSPNPISSPNPSATSNSSASASLCSPQPPVHFSPLDDLLMWRGCLWDPRVRYPVHHFDQLTDFGGGGFHPHRNEVRRAGGGEQELWRKGRKGGDGLMRGNREAVLL